MNNQIVYGLEGSYKVDIYKGKDFVYTTDYFSNFITPTGLMYPLTYAFADCFRFLSIGRDSTVNQGTNALGSTGTTGLSDPITSYTTSIGTTQRGQYIGWEGYASGETNSLCGTALSESGPRFYRAWNIPTGGEEIYISETGGGLQIGEFMVSPSSGEDTVGKSAFSRVIRNLFIPNGHRAIVTYQLKINNQNTGITQFGAGTFKTGDAEITNDESIIAGWYNLSGYYKQVYHGLRCVDNLGLTYIPKFGDGMEPATRNTAKMVWYLSPDNSQFDVATSGGNQGSVNSSYKADGLMGHIKSLDLKTNAISYPSWSSLSKSEMDDLYGQNVPKSDILTNFPNDSTLTNIRIGSNNGPLTVPKITNYTETLSDTFTYQEKVSSIDSLPISYATPGKDGYNDAFTDFGKQAIFSSNSIKLPFSTGGQNAITGRKKTITRKSVFSPVSSLGINTRFGSMVHAYEAQEDSAEGNSLYYPMIDVLFYDNSGQSMMPHYRYISGIHLIERGTGILESDIFLSGTNGNIFKFVTRKSFQGPYSSTSSHHMRNKEILHPEDSSLLGVSGFMASGSFDSNATEGQTGSLTINGIVYTGGWGSVYGVLVDSGFYTLNPDLGLAEHHVLRLQDPNGTGQLYWPVVSSSTKLNLYVKNVKFYTPELENNVVSGVEDWYGPTKQIVKDVNFDILTNSYAPVPYTTYTKNVTGSGVSPNLFSGFYITTGRYYNSPLAVNDGVRGSSYGFTGYVIPKSIDDGNYFKGGIWTSPAGLPTARLNFTPQMTGVNFTGKANTQKVHRLFTGITDRGYPNGTGGTPIRANDPLLVFFSGFSGSNPLYFTMLSGSGTSTMAFSYLSGVVTTTNFKTPSGYPLHGENFGPTGWKLARNYSPATYYSDDGASPVIGGSYVASSLENALVTYLDLSWRSDCGAGTTNCTNPV